MSKLMITTNYIVANYNPPLLHKSTKGQVSFAGQADYDSQNEVIINGVFFPKDIVTKSDNTLSVLIHSIKGIRFSGGLIKNELAKLNNLNISTTTSVEDNALEKIKKLSSVINQVPFLENRQLKEVIATGYHTVALDIGKNPIIREDEVLKLSDIPNYPKAPNCPSSLDRVHEPSFDLPIRSKGFINGMYYYVQPKVDDKEPTDIDFNELKKEIKKKYNTSIDFMKHQTGYYKGKLHLLDPECAVPKNQTASLKPKNGLS